MKVLVQPREQGMIQTVLKNSHKQEAFFSHILYMLSFLISYIYYGCNILYIQWMMFLCMISGVYSIISNCSFFKWMLM